MDAVLAGRWTVDMFAMFHLGRPDVFPLGDLAVRKGLQELYKLKVHLFLLHLMQVQIQEAADLSIILLQQGMRMAVHGQCMTVDSFAT